MEWAISIAWAFGFLMMATAVFAPLMRSRYGFLLGAVLYSLVDVIQGAVGLWTFTGALTWGIVGLLFARFNPAPKIINFFGMSVAGTLVFDFITGPVLSPLIWGMPFADSLIGQIPFTLSHLLGNVAITCLVAPIAYAYLANQKVVKSFLLTYGVYKPLPQRQPVS